MKGYWIVVPGPRGVNGSDVKTVCCPHISSIGAAKAARRAAAQAEASRLRLCLPMRFGADDSCNELFCCHWVWQDLAPVLLARGPSRPAMIGWRSALSPGRVVPAPDGPTDWRSSSLGCRGFQEVNESMRFGQAVEMPLIRTGAGAIRHYMISWRLGWELTILGPEARAPERLVGRLTAQRQGGRHTALPRVGPFQDRHRQAHRRVPYDPLQLHEDPRPQAEPLACISVQIWLAPCHRLRGDEWIAGSRCHSCRWDAGFRSGFSAAPAGCGSAV